MNARPRAKSWPRGPLNACATAEHFTCSRFNFAEAPVNNVNTDTIWQPTFQKQLGVSVHGGSYVVNLFKQKVVLQKNDLVATVTVYAAIFLSWTLWPSSLHKWSIDICIEERYVYTHSQIKSYSVYKKKCSQRNITQKQLEPYYWSFAMGALQ